MEEQQDGCAHRYEVQQVQRKGKVACGAKGFALPIQVTAAEAHDRNHDAVCSDAAKRLRANVGRSVAAMHREQPVDSQSGYEGQEAGRKGGIAVPLCSLEEIAFNTSDVAEQEKRKIDAEVRPVIDQVLKAGPAGPE